MQPKWRRGYGGVGSGVKTSWLAPHGANQPSCSALPSLRRHHPASPNPQRSTHLPQAPLEEFRAPNELETVKTVKETSSHILTAGEQRNIWEDSTLLHLQKKPTVKLGKHFPSLLLSYWGEKKTDRRKDPREVRHPEDDLFPWIQDAGAPDLEELGARTTFSLKRTAFPLITKKERERERSPDYDHFIDVISPIWLSGFYPETPAIPSSRVQPKWGSPSPGRRLARSRSPRGRASRLAPPLAPGLRCWASTSAPRRGGRRGYRGLLEDPA